MMDEPVLFVTFREVLGIGDSDLARDALMALFDCIVQEAERGDDRANELAAEMQLTKLGFAGQFTLGWMELANHMALWHADMMRRCFALGYQDGFAYEANGRDAEIAREEAAGQIDGRWMPKWNKLMKVFRDEMGGTPDAEDVVERYETAMLAYYHYMQEKLYLAGVGVARRLQLARLEEDAPME